MFAGKQLAGPAKSGGNLIGNQQNAFPVAHLADALQPFRMIHPHAAGALHDGLENDRCDLIPMGRHQAGKRHHIPFIPLAAKAALRRRGEQIIRQIALPQAVHGVIRIADRHRAKGIAVVAIAEGEKTPPRFAFCLPVLQGHLHGHFHRDRTGVGEEYALQRRRGHRHQLAAQRHRRRVGDTAKHHVRHLVNLRFHRGVQARVIVTVDCRPP